MKKKIFEKKKESDFEIEFSKDGSLIIKHKGRKIGPKLISTNTPKNRTPSLYYRVNKVPFRICNTSSEGIVFLSNFELNYLRDLFSQPVNQIRKRVDDETKANVEKVLKSIEHVAESTNASKQELSEIALLTVMEEYVSLCKSLKELNIQSTKKPENVHEELLKAEQKIEELTKQNKELEKNTISYQGRISRKNHADMFARKMLPEVIKAHEEGIKAYGKLAQYFNEKGLSSARGKEFRSSAVFRLIKRQKELGLLPENLQGEYEPS